MLKRGFITPFWWMLVMGFLAGCRSVSILHFLIERGARVTLVSKLSLFYLPVIMSIEAVMYWSIRRRITHRRDVWSHLLLFTGAYVVNFAVRAVMWAILILHSSAALSLSSYMSIIGYGQLYFFWGLVIAAHFFFARVLIKAFAKPPVEEETGESGNLLDDVLD